MRLVDELYCKFLRFCSNMYVYVGTLIILLKFSRIQEFNLPTYLNINICYTNKKKLKPNIVHFSVCLGLTRGVTICEHLVPVSFAT